MSDPLDTVRGLFDAWNSGDPDIDRFTAPGFRWNGDPMHLSIPQGPARFAEMRHAVPGELRLSIGELLDLGDGRVLVLGMGDLVSAKGGFAQELGWIATVRDGLVTSATVYPDRATARRAAGLPDEG